MINMDNLRILNKITKMWIDRLYPWIDSFEWFEYVEDDKTFYRLEVYTPIQFFMDKKHLELVKLRDQLESDAKMLFLQTQMGPEHRYNGVEILIETP